MVLNVVLTGGFDCVRRP
ncbi:TPA: hypothetical protein ACYZWI_004150 [Escherichia coli]